MTKLVDWSVRGDLVPIFFGSRPVHVPRIPFVAERRDGIRSPVNENSEFCVLIPRRHLIFLQRFPVRTVRAFVVQFINVFNAGGALAVVLTARLLPNRVSAYRILRRRRSRSTLRIQDGRYDERE